MLGSSIGAVATPAALVDLDVLERNIARMAARAREAGVRLRPHAKTHKCPAIGRLRRAAGAWGLSVAKVGEAEVFADAGFDDLLVAYPVVGEDKGRRLLALADRVRLAVGVDSVEGARTLVAPFHAARRTLDVLLKVDAGTAASAFCRSTRSSGRGRSWTWRTSGCEVSSPTPATVLSGGALSVDSERVWRFWNRNVDANGGPPPTPQNEFSGPNYRCINFVVDLPLRIDDVAPRATPAIGFAQAEFQMFDRETQEANSQG